MSHCNQGIGGTGDEEQEHPRIETESHPSDSNMIQLENMQDPFEEIIHLPLDESRMDLWDMLDEESKETSTPSSACSSHITYSSQADGKGAENEMHSMLKSMSPNDHDHYMGHMEAKQELPKEILEIPVEADCDFWDMLDDDLCSFSCGGSAFGGLEAHLNADINEELREEVDYRRMRCLENELELWMMGNDHYQSLASRYMPNI